MISRRKFLSTGLGLACAADLASLVASCKSETNVKGSLSGPDYSLGHRLRQGKFPAPSQTIKTEVVIVGGGVSGLAAARQLARSGVDFRLVEMESDVGGNSSSGRNAVSAYPLGAHYLPLPGLGDLDLLSFLEEAGAITGYKNSIPVYNEYYLCFDPKERLYIHDHWQEGLVPHEGITSLDASEFSRFGELIQYYKEFHGADGKEAFCIPLSQCSIDPAVRKLDKISFGQFLQEQRFKSSYLNWYVSYCCADDYGGTLWNTSAWAGIHYFASRKGVGYNAPADSVLTWPEGNGWLVSKLRKYSEGRTITKGLVYAVQHDPQNVRVDYFEPKSGISIRIMARKAILATPQFVNQRILSGDARRELDYSAFVYAPWMVANLTCSGDLADKRGERLSWDNVIYGSPSLGYVNANHQDLNRYPDKRVITYYFPLTGDDARSQRKTALQRTFTDWYKILIADLQKPHPKIENDIASADLWIWGHGMIRPSVGFMTDVSPRAAQPLSNKIFFAHSDVSGISIFEEAFHRGTQAAKRAIT